MILMLSLAAFLVAYFCIFNATASNQIDHIALLSFKGCITKDPHGVLSSWNNSISLCQWHGIKCEVRHQRVVELDLRSQSLARTIAPFIGNLTFLRSIYLQENRFRGNIPQEIDHLSRLQSLNFSFNTLQWEIPNNLSHCLDLRVIDLGNNNLVGKILATFDSLSKLTSLYIYSNNLHGNIPPSFGNLSFVQDLSIEFNYLRGTIPKWIGHMRSLKFCSIRSNNFSGILPPSLHNISTLTYLFISRNQLIGNLPWDIALTLSNLCGISIRGNQFTESFPASFSNSSEMRILDLCCNKFIGPVPVDFGRRMNDLRILNLGPNYLGNGVTANLLFVDSLTNCTNLNVPTLNDNGFGGVLPNSIINLSTQLRIFLAEGSQFVGNILDDISSFFKLFKLGLERNNFSGSIPFKIGILQNLQHYKKTKF